MLLLSRKLGEVIRIGDDILVTVVEIDRGKIRLGIQAPEDVRVDRQEVRAKRDEEAKRAAAGKAGT